jgi:hypothetical protein
VEGRLARFGEHRAAQDGVVGVAGTTAIGGNILASEQSAVRTAALWTRETLGMQVAFEPGQTLRVIEQVGDGEIEHRRSSVRTPFLPQSTRHTGAS